LISHPFLLPSTSSVITTNQSHQRLIKRSITHSYLILHSKHLSSASALSGPHETNRIHSNITHYFFYFFGIKKKDILIKVIIRLDANRASYKRLYTTQIQTIHSQPHPERKSTSSHYPKKESLEEIIFQGPKRSFNSIEHSSIYSWPPSSSSSLP